MSARSSVPIIVNGDFGHLGTANLPDGWALVSTPTISSVTSTGLGNGISMSGTVGHGIQYTFNVKPCTHYTVVLDIKGKGKAVVGRSGCSFTELASNTFDVGTSTWSRIPAINLGILTFESNSSDSSLVIRLLINDASTAAQYAQVQIWEGSWPRPFQDLRQALSTYFALSKFTSRAIPFANSNGKLTESAALTFDSEVYGGLLRTVYFSTSGFDAGIVSVSIDTTLDHTHFTVLVDASGGNRTITLPTGSGLDGRIYTIKKTDSSLNTVTIDGDGTETIDGATTKVLTTQYESAMIQYTFGPLGIWHVLA